MGLGCIKSAAKSAAARVKEAVAEREDKVSLGCFTNPPPPRVHLNRPLKDIKPFLQTVQLTLKKGKSRSKAYCEANNGRATKRAKKFLKEAAQGQHEQIEALKQRIAEEEVKLQDLQKQAAINSHNGASIGTAGLARSRTLEAMPQSQNKISRAKPPLRNSTELSLGEGKSAIVANPGRQRRKQQGSSSKLSELDKLKKELAIREELEAGYNEALKNLKASGGESNSSMFSWFFLGAGITGVAATIFGSYSLALFFAILGLIWLTWYIYRRPDNSPNKEEVGKVMEKFFKADTVPA